MGRINYFHIKFSPEQDLVLLLLNKQRLLYYTINYTCSLTNNEQCIILNQGAHQFPNTVRVKQIGLGRFGFLYAFLSNTRTIHVLEVLPSSNTNEVKLVEVNELHFNESFVDFAVSYDSPQLVTFSGRNIMTVYKIHSAYDMTMIKTLPLHELEHARFLPNHYDSGVLFERFDHLLCTYVETKDDVYALIYFLNTTVHDSLAMSLSLQGR